MLEDRLKDALLYDKTKNPERSNASFERLEEVLNNVLSDDSEKIVTDLKSVLKISDNIRMPLDKKQVDSIVDFFNQKNLKPEEFESIVEQLEYSEISTNEALDLHKKYKIPVSHLEKDIIPVKGQGCWIFDTKGRWFLDMDSNYSATNLGMNNPEVAQGLFNQANLLVSMKEDRVQIARTRFLREISSMMPSGLDFFYWQNSGGEAVDKAIKIAKAYTGTKNVIAFKNGFHGRTHGAVSVTWNKKYREPFLLHEEEWVHFAEFNNIDSVKNLVEKTGARIVIMEMVQGEEAGNLPADPDFIEKLWKLREEKNLVIIDDEVQAGFARTAVKKDEWFACMSYNVVPDIMVIGKSFGGGYPVTAVVTSEDVSDAMKPGYDGSTFGGNPMAMTSALIATRQMKQKDITKNVIERGRQIEKGLKDLRKKHPVIKEIRGRGLMIAFSLGSSENVSKLQDELRNQGVKTSLSTGEYMRLLPPTIIDEGEVNTFLERLDKALNKI